MNDQEDPQNETRSNLPHNDMDPGPKATEGSITASSLPEGFSGTMDGVLFRVKRRREDAPLEDLVLTRRIRSSSKRLKEDKILAGFQGLTLSNGSFKATLGDSFGITRQQLYKRVATLTSNDLKNRRLASQKLNRVLWDSYSHIRCPSAKVSVLTTQRLQSISDIRRSASQEAHWSKLISLRSAHPCMNRKEVLIPQLIESFKKKDMRLKPSTGELLLRDYCDRNMTPEERASLRDMFPEVHEEYKRMYNLTEEEATAEDDYVYDYYVQAPGDYEEEFVAESYGSKHSQADSEDSNAEDWYANDYPEEEDAETQGTEDLLSSDCSRESQLEDDAAAAVYYTNTRAEVEFAQNH